MSYECVLKTLILLEFKKKKKKAAGFVVKYVVQKWEKVLLLVVLRALFGDDLSLNFFFNYKTLWLINQKSMNLIYYLLQGCIHSAYYLVFVTF